ncbi:MAG: mechanosensitive ion channel family protein [Psychromonas sp.]
MLQTRFQFLILLFFLLLPVTSMAEGVVAINSETPIDEASSIPIELGTTTSIEDALDKLDSVDVMIERGLQYLPEAKGEERTILLMYISQMVNNQTRFVNYIWSAYKSDPDILDKDQLQTLLKSLDRQYDLIDNASELLDKALREERRELGDVTAQARLKIELDIREIEFTRNKIYEHQARVITWLDQFGQPISAKRKVLELKLLQRADMNAMLIRYADNELKKLQSEQDVLGDTTEKSHAMVVQAFLLKKSTSSVSLGSTIKLLESFDVPVINFKEIWVNSSDNLDSDIYDVALIKRLLGRWVHEFSDWFYTNALKILMKIFVAGLIIFFFIYLANQVSRLMKRGLRVSKLNLTQLMQDFFSGIAHRTIIFLGIMLALVQLGIDLGPLLAGFGIAGVVIGLALQDTLSNFAAGIMMLIYRPFDVNDVVVAGGVSGKVVKLSMVNTVIKTFDNQRIVVPNKMIWENVITNVTAEKVRRVDLVFGIGYGDDIDKARQLLEEVVTGHEKVMKTPAPTIAVYQLGESSVDFWVRPWVHTDDYWDVYLELTREVKLRFDESGINIPFPQRDVHLHPTAQLMSLYDRNNPDDLAKEE